MSQYPTLDQGCYSDWHIDSYPDLTGERHRRLGQHSFNREEIDPILEMKLGHRKALAINGTNRTIYEGVGRIMASDPSDKDNICMPGAYGPLCHACEEGWFFDSNGDLTCKECTSSSVLGVLAGLSSFFVLAFLGWVIEYRGVIYLPAGLKKALHLKKDPQLPFMGALASIPSCQLKLIWSTFQIVQSIGKNLDLSFPGPMVRFNEDTSMLNLEFLDVGCSSVDTNFHSYVYSASAFPLILVACLWLAYCVERAARAWKLSHGATFTAKDERDFRKRLFDVYVERTLACAYMFLPTAAMAQFQGMNCFSYEASTQSFLKTDSSIDCNSGEHQAFLFYNVFLIIFYQSIILLFFCILYMNLDKIKPVSKVDGDMDAALRLRDLDRSIDHIRFLFDDLHVTSWYHEIFDMYRRMFFIGVLPLTSEEPVTKAYIGTAAAMAMAIYFREMMPSRNPFTNLLAVLAQYQIMFVYLAALFMLSGALRNTLNISEIALGDSVLFANFIVVIGAVYAAWFVYLQDLDHMKRRERKIAKIDYAVQYDDETFESILDNVSETSLLQSTVLVYHYTSIAAAKNYVRNGIPVFTTHQYNCWSAAYVDACQGVVFSLKGPHEIKHGDPCLEKMSPLSACREAVLCVAVPRELLWPVIESSVHDYDFNKIAALSNGTSTSSKMKLTKVTTNDATFLKAQKIEALNHLVVVPTDVLTAFSRSGLDKDEIIIEMRRWGPKLNVKKPVLALNNNELNSNKGTSLRAHAAYLDTTSQHLHSCAYDDAFMEKGFDSKYDLDLETDEGTSLKSASNLMNHEKDVNCGTPVGTVENIHVPAGEKNDKRVVISEDTERRSDFATSGNSTFPPVTFASHNILRAYQLVPDAELDESLTCSLKDLVCPEVLSDIAYFSSQYDRTRR